MTIRFDLTDSDYWQLRNDLGVAIDKYRENAAGLRAEADRLNGTAAAAQHGVLITPQGFRILAEQFDQQGTQARAMIERLDATYERGPA